MIKNKTQQNKQLQQNEQKKMRKSRSKKYLVTLSERLDRLQLEWCTYGSPASQIL
jgi:hypothetical protein